MNLSLSIESITGWECRKKLADMLCEKKITRQFEYENATGGRSCFVVDGKF